MMKWRILVFVMLGIPMSAWAQEPLSRAADVYGTGVVEKIESTNESDPLFASTQVQVITVNLDGTILQAEYADNQDTTADDLHLGEKVVVLQTEAFVGETRYIVIDKYRLPSVAWLLALFFLSAIVFAGRKGITSVLGLAASLAVLLSYTVPSIIAGHSPFFVATISAFVIAFLSITIAHGVSRQTAVALLSTLVSLVLSLGLAHLFVLGAKLFGLGTEDAYTLSLAGLGSIDLRGLLLAGIVIGVLGVLDDVTTTQTATIQQIARVGRQSFTQLYKAGMSVGREHIVSLVNTLALAYVGASLPLLLLFSFNEGQTPYWVLLNGQMIIEEIIRTLVGSTALMLAVPISTLFAAWFYARYPRWAQEGSTDPSH